MASEVSFDAAGDGRDGGEFYYNVKGEKVYSSEAICSNNVKEERSLRYKEFNEKRDKEQLQLREELRYALKIAIFKRLEAQSSWDKELIDSKDLSDLIRLLMEL